MQLHCMCMHVQQLAESSWQLMLFLLFHTTLCYQLIVFYLDLRHLIGTTLPSGRVVFLAMKIIDFKRWRASIASAHHARLVYADT